jgi:hypothetical protein
LVAAAARARKQIGGQGKAGAEEYVGGYRSAPRHTQRAFDDITKQADRSAKQQAKAAEKAAKDQARAYEYVYQIKKRYLEKEERDADRSLHKQEANRRRMLSSAGRTFGGIVTRGMGLAGDVARGAGVNFDVASLVGKNVKTQSTATDITASAYVEGASGSVGKRQDPKAVIAAAKEAANAAAIDEEKALSGLQKFVGKSTDLETGMRILKEMAIQSKATGSNLEDVMDAAGDIAVKLEDTPDKAKVLAGVMATVAKQGQLGASELRTMAPFIGRIVSSSNQFAEGSEKAAQELGAVFQITKKMQGQTVGAAATATNRFVEALSSKSGLKSLYGPGKLKQSDVFDEHGKTRGLSEIIPKLLAVTKGGDPREVAKLLPNVNAAKVLKAFAQPYQEGEKQGKGGGKKAIEALFGEYGGSMSQKQISESLAAALQTTESKAQLFQNRLQAIADDNLPKVIGSLEKLAPVAASAAEAFARFVGWAAENPGQALTAAIAASIAKAAVGEAVGKALAASLGSRGGLILGTATIAVTTGMFAIDAFYDAKGHADAATENSGLGAVQGASALRAARESGTIDPGVLAAKNAQITAMELQISRAEAAKANPNSTIEALGGIDPLSALANYVTNGAVGKSWGGQANTNADVEHLGQLKADLATLKAAMDKVHSALTSGTLKVHVTNQPGGPGGASPGAGSTTSPIPIR